MNTPTIRAKMMSHDFASDGNAFAIMGQVSRELRRAGADPEYIKAFRAEAMSGDYDHLVQVCMSYTDFDEGDDE